ncbi:hypothetical protein AO385_0882 [Moraxella catarrhalis]|nr:hypothetical protein AO385_0882 [Moraxella catarrhalis]
MQQVAAVLLVGTWVDLLLGNITLKMRLPVVLALMIKEG